MATVLVCGSHKYTRVTSEYHEHSSMVSQLEKNFGSIQPTANPIQTEFFQSNQFPIQFQFQLEFDFPIGKWASNWKMGSNQNFLGPIGRPIDYRHAIFD